MCNFLSQVFFFQKFGIVLLPLKLAVADFQSLRLFPIMSC